MGYTSNLSLYLEDDTKTKFIDWRTEINGEASGKSNMHKIDTAYKNLADKDKELDSSIEDVKSEIEQVREDIEAVKEDIEGELENYVKKSSTSTIGNGSTKTFTITHSLNSYNVKVSAYTTKNGTREPLWLEYTISSLNAISVSFDEAPSSNSVVITVMA